MNVSALAAGWPFAILLMLDTRCGDRAPLCDIVIKKDQRSKALVLDRDGIVYPVKVNVATTICGMDGYPVSIDDVHVGDHVGIGDGGHEGGAYRRRALMLPVLMLTVLSINLIGDGLRDLLKV